MMMMMPDLVPTTAVSLEASELGSYKHEDKDDISWVDEGCVLPALQQQRTIDGSEPRHWVLGVELTQATSAAVTRLATETTSTATAEQKLTETPVNTETPNLTDKRRQT